MKVWFENRRKYMRGCEFKQLALKIGLTESQLKVWFVNRRKYARGYKCEQLASMISRTIAK